MKRPIILRRWATEGICNPVPDEKYAAGFVSEKPDEYYLNQMQLDEESFIIANMETGIPSDGADAVSYADKAIYFEDGLIYVRVAGVNPPSIVCRPYQTVKDELQAFYDACKEHIEDDTNPHKVTASQADTYDKPEFDKLNKGQYQDLDRHIRSRNPHKVNFKQLNCLGVIEGGLFTGVVDFAKGVTVGGFFLNSIKDSFSFGSEAISFGLTKVEPVVDTPEGRQILFHEGNYYKERNKLQPKYSLPPPLCVVPFVSSLNFLKGNNILESSWDDLKFSEDGLEIEGELTFSEPTRLVSLEQTIRFIMKYDVSVSIGNIVISKNTGQIHVVDSGTEIWTGSAAGSVTYARTPTHGYVYINGSLVAEKAHDETPLELNATIGGSGHIKELYIWGECLTKEQAASMS